MIKTNLKLSFRGLRKNRFYSILGISGFAFGFAICIMVGLYIYNELTFDNCFENNNRIYRVINVNEHQRISTRLDYNDNDIFIDKYPEIEKICPVNISTNWERSFIADEKPFFAKGFLTTTNDFFDIFQIKILKSVSDQPFSEINSIILTESMSKRLFGDINSLGKEFILDGDKVLNVSAVIEDFPSNSSLQANLLFNAENKDIRASFSGDGKGNYYYSVNQYILIKKSGSAIDLQEKMNRTLPDYNTRAEKVELQPLTKIYLAKYIEGNNNLSGSIFSILVFAAIALLILILSIINQVNFTISLQYSKLKEIGIKKTVGANFQQLIVFHFTETFLWMSIALFISLIIVGFGLPYSEILFSKKLEFATIYSFPFIFYLITSLLFIIAITSCAPVFILSKFNILTFMSGKIIRTGKQRGKKGLTIAQITTSVFLLISVIVVHRQVDFMKHEDIGFNKESLLQIKLPSNYKETEIIKNQLLNSPTILNACVTSGAPGMINYNSSTGPRGKEFRISRLGADHDFLNTFGIDLLAGRDFNESTDPNACLITKTMLNNLLEAYEWESWEGHQVNEFNIIGVVKDFHVSSMHNPLESVLITHNYQPTALTLKIKSEDLGETMTSIKNTWSNISPEEPYSYQFYDEWFNAMYISEERLSKSMNIFSIIAFVITCMGLLGQIFYITINKTKEIGIRKVNGAKVSEILTMLNKDFIKWVIIAFVIATPIAYYAMNKWLENFAYKTSLSWWIFALAGLLALGIALLTVSWQSWRAATRNPVKALRYE